MGGRNRARGWALQALYAWELRGAGRGSEIPVLHDVVEGRRVAPHNRAYAEVLVRLVAGNSEEIDRAIEAVLTNWTLERLSAVDRTILRIGTAEVLFVDDVPLRRTLGECVRLAERYGTDGSPRFVNGVLDAIVRRAGGQPAPEGA